MKRWAIALQLTAVGWYIALSLLIPSGIGLWLDKKFNSLPLLTFIGLSLGTIIMIYGVYRMLRQFQAAMEEEDRSTRKSD